MNVCVVSSPLTRFSCCRGRADADAQADYLMKPVARQYFAAPGWREMDRLRQPAAPDRQPRRAARAPARRSSPTACATTALPHRPGRRSGSCGRGEHVQTTLRDDQGAVLVGQLTSGHRHGDDSLGLELVGVESEPLRCWPRVREWRRSGYGLPCTPCRLQHGLR